MPLVIQLVVGEFELVKADHLPHPRVPWGQRIWVDVDPRRNRRVCVSRHHPLGAVVHIPRKHSGKPGLSNTGAHKRIHEDESELMLEIQRFHLTLHVLEDLCMFKSSNSKCYCKLVFFYVSSLRLLLLWFLNHVPQKVSPWLVFPPHFTVLKTHLRLFEG